MAVELIRRALMTLGRILRVRKRLPLRGYTPANDGASLVGNLSDKELAELNDLLPWHAFTVDERGRRFGNAAWYGKRTMPQPIPDPRVLLADREFRLSDKHVLEVGCFEGIHTIALCRVAQRVTALDARIENVVKTIVRCALYGCRPEVLLCDLENPSQPTLRDSCDILFHVGVLYHLSDPVRHILALGQLARRGVFLDTHFAEVGRADAAYEVGGRIYRYRPKAEGGRRDPFSGMGAQSKWLLADDISQLLIRAGFPSVRLVETRMERNGPRGQWIAKKAGPTP